MTSNAAGTLCALVAIKSRQQCKSRLAGELSDAARLALVRSMLANVLLAVQRARCVQRVFVISPERDAVPAGVAVLADDGNSLNGALAHAHARLHALGYAEALILPADLPYLRGLELEAFVEAGRDSGFAIAPDIARRGTNALYLPTSVPFTFRFGTDSLHQHLQEAAWLGLAASVMQLPGLEFDVDEPADLQALGVRRDQPQHEGNAWHTLTRM